MPPTDPNPPSANSAPAGPLPVSLGAHVVPPERLAPILPHAHRLAEAARAIGDELAFSADAADFAAVLESEAE